MRIAVFDTHRYDREALEAANRHFGHDLAFFEPRLTRETAPLAGGFPAVCSFVNDRLDRQALDALAAEGVRLVLLRSAGYNHVDLEAARRLGLRVSRVPEYSPHAVAEHAFALLLCLDRKIHRAYFRVRDANFTLEGLVGFDLHGKTFGVLGTGRIGAAVARIAHGFGCRVLAFDLRPDPDLEREAGVTYVQPETVYAESDVISLHVPLTPKTHHLIGQEALRRMKRGAYLINTGRGALINRALTRKVRRVLALDDTPLPSVAPRADPDRLRTHAELQERLDKAATARAFDDQSITGIARAVRGLKDAPILELAVQQAGGRLFATDYQATEESWAAAQLLDKAAHSNNPPALLV
jgi:D-lactate dehydrogenase